jgi:hypothetical protein
LSHENGFRVFKGDYQERGAYRDGAVDQDELTFGDQALTWNGEPITWD